MIQTQTSEIKVSIIVPVYNVQAYIKQCIESILSQSLREIEVIFVNDASPDKSAQIIESFAKIDPRIRLINNPENVGVGAARNKGLEAAKGKYVKIIDSDDFLTPNCLQNLYATAEGNQLDIVFHNAISYTNDDKQKTYYYPERHKELQLMCGHAAWWYLFRREITCLNPQIRFPIGAHPHEDTTFSFMLITYCRKHRFIPQELIYYRQHDNMVMQQIQNKKREQNSRSAAICIHHLINFFAAHDKQTQEERKKAYTQLLGFLLEETSTYKLPKDVRRYLLRLKIQNFLYRDKITQSNHRIIKICKIPVFRKSYKKSNST